jgi:hypothetical protein
MSGLVLLGVGSAVISASRRRAEGLGHLGNGLAEVGEPHHFQPLPQA